MENILFLQSEVDDPYALYARMRAVHPVCHDERKDIWAAYSHAGCKRILAASTAHIPAPETTALLNAPAAMLAANLARLGNPPEHAARREAVLRLFRVMQPLPASELLETLLGRTRSAEIDWVDAVCKKLPALAVMTAFGFPVSAIERILPRIAALTKIMLPHPSQQQLAELNDAASEVCSLVEQHFQEADVLRSLADDDACRTMYVSNLIGLLIQSHDAGRGILGNSLLHALQHPNIVQGRHWQKMVIETLRFDSPIQNTRRVLTEAIEIDGIVIPAGQSVLVVLAAANRDPSVFAHPDQYDITRSNNGDHLSFGAGAHLCAAQHFSVRLAADVLASLFAGGRRVHLLQSRIAYEPMVNARLPKQLMIAIDSYSS
ncbi:cytochrome P450 [Noviherbaspirillum sp.]|jgi:cytochrome P450|uniref:cytochrome P450 n=1 Tax=Noviherbaspirillum sp. TaxID=1926288 RepID=UPI0025E772DA|nr:cytochrome P450 [Noviherbaspirillum sp.]